MIDRILEPEVMDSAEEARDYDAMDHATVNRGFVEDFRAVWNGRGPILDIGTGTALIPIELCGRVPAVEIVAIDLAENMLTLARENVRRSSFNGRIRLETANARAMLYADASFGAVMSNSIVHHIPDPNDLFAEIVRVAAAGATLFIRDLLRPNDATTLTELVETYAGRANDRQKRLFAASLHAALTLDEVRGMVAALGFDSATVRQTSDRHWTWSVRCVL